MVAAGIAVSVLGGVVASALIVQHLAPTIRTYNKSLVTRGKTGQLASHDPAQCPINRYTQSGSGNRGIRRFIGKLGFATEIRSGKTTLTGA